MIKASLIKENTGIAGIILFLFGLIFSPFILSISFIPLLIQPFITYSPSTVFKKLFKDKISLLVLLYFLLILLGVFYSSDLAFFWKDLQLKLPMLLLPFAFTCSKYYSKKIKLFILATFLVFTFIAGLLSFINYLFHYNEINQLIFKAKPTPIIANINHIYYSILLAFAIMAGIIIHINHLKKKGERLINLLVIILNIVFIHTIAARTGLFAFYASLFVLLMYYGFKGKKVLLTIASIVIIASIGVSSIKYIPVLNNRYQKSVEDINTYRNGGDINHYSISMRLEYWDKSFKVFLTSPIIGVGMADIKPEMQKLFEEEGSILEPINRKGPHNQYIEILAGLGLIGFIVFVVLLLKSVTIAMSQKSGLLLAFILIMIFTFFAESTLERQAGISFFTFTLLFLTKPETDT